MGLETLPGVLCVSALGVARQQSLAQPLFVALSIRSSAEDPPLAGGNGGVGSAHSLGGLRPWGRAGAEQQRVTGGSVAGRVLGIRTASHVTCHYFFSPCYSLHGPSSREEHLLGCMLNVQNRKRKGLAGNVSWDHFSFHGGARASIFIPNKAGRGQLGTSLERSWHSWQETGRDAPQPKVDK